MGDELGYFPLKEATRPSSNAMAVLPVGENKKARRVAGFLDCGSGPQ
jgi:hypothetical protein